MHRQWDFLSNKKVIDLIKHDRSTIQETKVKSTKTVKEAYTFLGITLAFSYFVFWGPLALLKSQPLVS